MASSTSHITTNHDEIRKWAERHGGRPTRVRGTGGDQDVGLLRIDFERQDEEEALEEISWDEFFSKFEEKHLAFLYQDEEKSGHENRFFKLIRREDEGAHGKKRSIASSHDRHDSHETRAGGHRAVHQRATSEAAEELSAELLEGLCELMKLDVDAVFAYEMAANAIRESEIKEKLIEFRGDHERHVLALENVVLGFGGTPPSVKPDFKEMQDLGGEVPKGESTLEILQAMESSEEMINQIYEDALKWDLDDDLKAMIRDHRNDEKRHLEFAQRTLRKMKASLH